jgi:hypothetical protein
LELISIKYIYHIHIFNTDLLENLFFVLGKSPEAFPEGLDRLLLGMCVNERRRIYFPPLLSFGTFSKGDMKESLPYTIYEVILVSLNGSTEP